jgi:hypothetical protein
MSPDLFELDAFLDSRKSWDRARGGKEGIELGEGTVARDPPRLEEPPEETAKLAELLLSGGGRRLLDRDATSPTEPALPLSHVEAIEDQATTGVIGKATVDEIDAEVVGEGMRDGSGQAARVRLVGGRVWQEIDDPLPVRLTGVVMGWCRSS